MKAILNLRKSIFYIAAIAAVFSLASCDDDGGDEPKPLTVNDINGTYKGFMHVTTPARESAIPTISVDVKVADANKITFDKFPVDSIVRAIEGEEVAKGIVEKMAAVKYEFTIAGKLNTVQDSVLVTTTPAVLEFKYKVADDQEDKEIKVTMTKGEGVDAYSAKTLKLNLVADEIKVNDVVLPDYNKQSISFNLNKN